MLYDNEFLINLDKYPHRVIYARITALTFQETPIEYIEGRVTQGSINIDGVSAMRRTCSLGIAAQDFNYNDFYWGLNTKFKLEIGLENHIDSSYPDIIWFPQGIYVITSFSTAQSTTGFNISIQGKDKMCLLNGEVGGALESSVNFGIIKEEDANGNLVTRQVSIQEIIKNIVHTYAHEPYYNIIINDLDTCGLELLEYKYTTPLFLYRKVLNSTYDGAVLGGEDVPCSVYKNGVFERTTTLSALTSNDLESLTDTLMDFGNVPEIEMQGARYYVAKIEQGQTAGYRLTDLVYAGDLIANIGESLTSVLDKIRNMLVEFEYFYNIDGQFVFQKKRSFKETIWQFDQQNNQNAAGQHYNEKDYAYKFYGGNLITSFSNTPNLLNLRNDYSIWGQRESVSGAKIPIHLRYAIDTPPKEYQTISVDYGFWEKESAEEDYKFKPGVDFNAISNYNQKYNTVVKGQQSKTYTTDDYDWREIIYQMALDYYQYNFLDDFELKVAAANPNLYPTGITGYEQYYIDLNGFWRDLYYPNLNQDIEDQSSKVTNQQNLVDLLQEEVYGEEGIEIWLKLFQEEKKTVAQVVEKYGFKNDDDTPVTDSGVCLNALDELFYDKKSELSLAQYQLELLSGELSLLDDKIGDFYTSQDMPDSNFLHWNKNVYESPELLNFWFDFLPASGELQQYSVKSIGVRSKSVNDTNIKSIYFRETPHVIYRKASDPQGEEGGFRYIQVSDFDYMFSSSAQGKSAKNKLDELLYQHSYCIESANISVIPIYHLEPNTRIYLHDEDTGLEGDYIISKLTIPLSFNGTMSISATKAVENVQ